MDEGEVSSLRQHHHNLALAFGEAAALRHQLALVAEPLLHVGGHDGHDLTQVFFGKDECGNDDQSYHADEHNNVGALRGKAELG